MLFGEIKRLVNLLQMFDIKELKLDDSEKKIHQTLSKDPIHLDQIITTTNLSVGSVNAALVGLRLKGLIKQLPGSFFRKNSPQFPEKFNPK